MTAILGGLMGVALFFFLVGASSMMVAMMLGNHESRLFKVGLPLMGVSWIVGAFSTFGLALTQILK